MNQESTTRLSFLRQRLEILRQCREDKNSGWERRNKDFGKNWISKSVFIDFRENQRTKQKILRSQVGHFIPLHCLKISRCYLKKPSRVMDSQLYFAIKTYVNVLFQHLSSIANTLNVIKLSYLAVIRRYFGENRKKKQFSNNLSLNKEILM